MHSIISDINIHIQNNFSIYTFQTVVVGAFQYTLVNPNSGVPIQNFMFRLVK